jgi:hypothetical protein
MKFEELDGRKAWREIEVLWHDAEGCSSPVVWPFSFPSWCLFILLVRFSPALSLCSRASPTSVSLELCLPSGCFSSTGLSPVGVSLQL